MVGSHFQRALQIYMVRQIRNEIAVLKHLSSGHRNIVTLHDYFEVGTIEMYRFLFLNLKLDNAQPLSRL